MPSSDRDAGRPCPLVSKSDCGEQVSHRTTLKIVRDSYLFLGPLSSSLDSIATLDNVRFEAYRTRSAVEFEEQPTGITQN